MSDELSINQKKKFIVDQAYLLDFNSKKSILSIILMEFGISAIIELKCKKELHIDLTDIANKSPSTICYIYNIVKTRHHILNLPAS